MSDSLWNFENIDKALSLSIFFLLPILPINSSFDFPRFPSFRMQKRFAVKKNPVSHTWDSIGLDDAGLISSSQDEDPATQLPCFGNDFLSQASCSVVSVI